MDAYKEPASVSGTFFNILRGEVFYSLLNGVFPMPHVYEHT